MIESKLASRSLTHPLQTLVLAFIFWKILLFSIALLSPGVGYDTSTDILLDGVDISSNFTRRLFTRLVRWDAIYFTKAAHRNYVYEQEWAFGWGFSRVVSVAAKYLYGHDASLALHAVVAVVVSNSCHLASLVVLHRILLRVSPPATRGHIALVGSLLHVLSPAGLFLCAPYAESAFAALNFTGLLLYVRSITAMPRTAAADVQLVIAGMLFGLSCTMRSNGFMNGVLFAYDGCLQLGAFLKGRIDAGNVRRLVSLGVGGVLTAAGFAWPQAIAYAQYCRDGTRPWCTSIPPSIYTFVQSHYWNVGFLRYWTPGNIPLFLLAAPMLWVMGWSSWAGLGGGWSANNSAASDQGQAARKQMLLRLALPQLVLTVLAVTSFHVQVITRISSGYPLLYWALAEAAAGGGRRRWSRRAVEWVVVYGLVQGALFASFLPPA